MHRAQLFEEVTIVVPQKAQNFAPGTIVLLHLEQVFDCLGATGLPQDAQNLAPFTSIAPQTKQESVFCWMTGADAPQPAQNFAFSFNNAPHLEQFIRPS